MSKKDFGLRGPLWVWLLPGLIGVLFGLGCGSDHVGSPFGAHQGLEINLNDRPTLAMVSSADSVGIGDSVTLSWDASNASICEASGGWSGEKAPHGSEQVGPLQKTQSFALSCSDRDTAILRELTVNVLDSSPEVRVSLDSDKVVVHQESQAQIYWAAVNAQRCEASGDWSGEQPVRGSFVTDPLFRDSTFSISCRAGEDSATALVSIEVLDGTVHWGSSGGR